MLHFGTNMIIVKQRFLRELQDKITNLSSSVVQGNLDPSGYLKTCAEIQCLRDTKELFEEIWNKSMKETDYKDD